MPADAAPAAELLSSVAGDDYYKILAIASGDRLCVDSSQQHIRSAYRKAALQLHPDKIGGEEESSIGSDGWNMVRLAYLVLSSPQRRARFDAGEAVSLDNLLTSDDAELDTLPIRTPSAPSIRLFKGHVKLVDHGNKISLYSPIIKNMSRKLKGNLRGDVSYISKNERAGNAINVIFHDGEWKWLRSKQDYTPDELATALETEQKLSRIGIEAFGLTAGHTQDWLKELEQEGIGHTPEGRASLTAAVHEGLKALPNPASSPADEAAGGADEPDGRSDDDGPPIRLLVTGEQAQILRLAAQTAAAKDDANTLEATGCKSMKRQFGIF